MPTIVAENTDHLRDIVAAAIKKNGVCADFNHIDVSHVSNFEGLFSNSRFNGDISRWDMGHATSTVDMFFASAFNSDISNWNVQRLRNANHMFHGAKFNGDISRWNPINLESADFMFAKAPFAGDVSNWHMPFLDSCLHMFDTRSFHGDLSQWTLPGSCLYGLMFHGSFKGKVPAIATTNMKAAYEMLLGNPDIVAAYARRTPFDALHAQLLLANGECKWASRKVVRWAQEMGEMGRAMGLEHDAIVQLMVQAYSTREDAPVAIATAHGFDAPM